MPLGQCKLCLQTKELQNSHLLPAAIYKLLRSDNADIPDPLTVRNDPTIKKFRVFQTSRQITGYVLCWECEQLINANGEDRVLPQLSTLHGFPLYEQLMTIAPDAAWQDTTGYSASKAQAIRIDFLAHFALGIFWKAAVHDWQTGQGTLRISLGPYRDGLKHYLLGGPFPKHTYLMTTLVPPPLPTMSARLPLTNRTAGFPFHSFYVPGVEFMLTVGNRVPDFLIQTCMVSNPAGPIMVSPFPAEFIGKNFAEAFQEGNVSPKLAHRLRPNRTRTQ
jgi:hypothetical protein